MSDVKITFFQIYIELFGPVNQPDNVPGKIHLKVRHLSGSFFRAGDNSIKKFVQTLEPRSIKFDRHTITDSEKCKERKQKGENPGIFPLRPGFNGLQGLGGVDSLRPTPLLTMRILTLRQENSSVS